MQNIVYYYERKTRTDKIKKERTDMTNGLLLLLFFITNFRAASGPHYCRTYFFPVVAFLSRRPANNPYNNNINRRQLLRFTTTFSNCVFI